MAKSFHEEKGGRMREMFLAVMYALEVSRHGHLYDVPTILESAYFALNGAELQRNALEDRDNKLLSTDILRGICKLLMRPYLSHKLVSKITEELRRCTLDMYVHLAHLSNVRHNHNPHSRRWAILTLYAIACGEKPFGGLSWQDDCRRAAQQRIIELHDADRDGKLPDEILKELAGGRRPWKEQKEAASA